MRAQAIALFAILITILTACGGSPSSPPPSGALSGNWQINLQQEYPTQTLLSASGFVAQANDALTGSIQVAPFGSKSSCAGVSVLTGMIKGQNVTFSLNGGGTVLDFSGTASTNGQTMSGDYQAVGGGCSTVGISGTWNAVLVPPLNGNFTGTLSNSQYMSLLTGVSPAAPIAVSGSMTQSSNDGASNATITGTINAVGYPCFTTASLTGTISGQNVVLSVFGYEGSQIGTLGSAETPAVASSGPNNEISLSTQPNGEMTLGKASATTVVGPCPPVGVGPTIGDSTVVVLTFQ
ncbi:MAG: hypothetical protein ACLPHI_14155 [Terriglobales bacterium]